MAKRLKTLAPGQVVLDNYGREVVVLGPTTTPEAGWIEGQKDERVRGLKTYWYDAAPLDAGMVCVPAELVKPLREVTEVDAMKLAKNFLRYRAPHYFVAQLYDRDTLGRAK